MTVGRDQALSPLPPVSVLLEQVHRPGCAVARTCESQGRQPGSTNPKDHAEVLVRVTLGRGKLEVLGCPSGLRRGSTRERGSGQRRTEYRQPPAPCLLLAKRSHHAAHIAVLILDRSGSPKSSLRRRLVVETQRGRADRVHQRADAGKIGSLSISPGSCWMTTVARLSAASCLNRSSEAIVFSRSELNGGTPLVS